MATLQAAPTPTTPTQPIDNLIDALRDRVKFTVIRKILKAAKLPVGQGWGDVTANASESTAQGSQLRAFLKQCFYDSLIAGEKYVQIFEVENKFIADVVAKLERATAPASEFSARYPFPLQQTGLTAASALPVLCGIQKSTGGDFAMVFCSARWYDDSEVYDYAQLPQHVQDTYRAIDKLVTYRKVYYQAYDVVIVRTKLSRIEVCVDHPAKAGSEGLYIIPLQVLSACEQHISEFEGMGATPPANLFSAIANMYAAKTEGKVTELSFRTLTGSIKKERMTADTVDLRAETFHHGGMNAVGQKINPYELTLEYEFKLPPGEATLRLSALLRELSSATPTLHGCFISAPTGSGFEQALNHLVTYI